MKLIDNRWVDDNNNSWNADIETEESVQKKSNTLLDCSNCSDCSDCINCTYCSDCTKCSNCTWCSSCSSCSDCSDCSGFKTNPQRITSERIGSRNSQKTYYWTEEHEQVVCGCFKGTLDEFEQRVKEVHGDNEHGIAYQKWIDKIKIYKN